MVFAILLFFGARQLGSYVWRHHSAVDGDRTGGQTPVSGNCQRYQAISHRHGQVPPNLNALTPKYLKPDALKPITLKDGTQIKWVYRPPKPDSAGDTVILEHTPPVTAEMKFGQTLKANLTLHG